MSSTATPAVGTMTENHTPAPAPDPAPVPASPAAATPAPTQARARAPVLKRDIPWGIIDAASFPHIMDRIIEVAAARISTIGALFRLRATSRHFKFCVEMVMPMHVQALICQYTPLEMPEVLPECDPEVNAEVTFVPSMPAVCPDPKALVYKWYCRERDKVIKRVAEWECRKHVLILEGLTVHSMFKDLDLPWDREDFRHVYRMFQEVFTAHSKKPFYAATKPELTAAVKHHWPLWVQQGATDFKTFKLVVERLKKLIKALLELTSNCPSRYIGIYPEVWKVGRTAVGGPITHLPARSPFLLDLTYKGNTANPSIIIRCNARYVRFDGDKTLHNASLGKTYIQVLQFDSEENELYPYFVRHVDAAEDLIVAIRLDGTGFCRDLLCYENDSDIRHLKSIRIIIVPPRQPCPPYRPGALENNFKELFRTLVQHLDEESGTLTIVDADSLPSQWFTTQKMTTENYFLLHILMNALSPSDLLRLVTSRPNRKVPLMDFASKKEYMEDFEVSEWEYNIQCGF